MQIHKSRYYLRYQRKITIAFEDWWRVDPVCQETFLGFQGSWSDREHGSHQLYMGINAIWESVFGEVKFPYRVNPLYSAHHTPFTLIRFISR